MKNSREELELLKNSGPSWRKRMYKISISGENQGKYNIKKACKVISISRSIFMNTLIENHLNECLKMKLSIEIKKDIWRA